MSNIFEKPLGKPNPIKHPIVNAASRPRRIDLKQQQVATQHNRLTGRWSTVLAWSGFMS
jgi:hypothetical protein